MSQLNDLFTPLICKVFHLIQASTLNVVKHWTIDSLKNALKFALESKKIIQNLSEDELHAVKEFSQILQHVFPHFPSSVFVCFPSVDILGLLIQNLYTNPYLSQANRDYLFEYCLDINHQLPKIDTYLNETKLVKNQHILSLIEIRMFSSKLLELIKTKNFNEFLDSCFLLDSNYLFHLLVRTLDLCPNLSDSELLIAAITQWISIALQNDIKVPILLCSLGCEYLRDIGLKIAEFGQIVLNLFDIKSIHFETDSTIISQLIDLARLLIRTDTFNTRIISRIKVLARENTNNGVWNYVLSSTIGE